MAKKPKHNFKEYLKNPNLFREEVREITQSESAPPARESKLVKLVVAMKTRSLEHDELWQLKKAVKKAAPYLLEALRDEDFRRHRYGPNAHDGSPLETALDLLEPLGFPDRTCLADLIAMLPPPDEVSYKILYHLARCGHDEAIEVLKAGLASDREDCRTYTLMGLEFLKNSPRGSAKFRAALFEATVPRLHDKEYGPAEHAPRALLVLDRGRAESVLLGEHIFRPDNEQIDDVLKALKDANVAVSGAKLRELLAGIKERATSYPFDYAYAHALILLARTEGPSAAAIFEDAQTWGNAKVKTAAAEAIQLAAGIADPYGFVCTLCEQGGVTDLTKPQLYYLVLWQLDAEVRNGGFSQYFFNSSSDLSCYVVEAAKAVGALEAARIIQKAIALFGEDGPYPDRDERMDQLSRVDYEAMRKLDTEYYECPENMDELLPQFVASNPDAFKPSD
ncbi:MAG TPA: DMP19 family protein [Gemmataceae bacterium]|nr:DMP19 family protein [Gemmataceae bacterium]